MMKKVLLLGFGIGMGCLLIMALARQRLAGERMHETPLPVIHVWLLEPITRMTGRPWPTRKDGRPLSMTAMEEPCQVVIHVPSGRAIPITAKTVIFNQDGDEHVVRHVSALPLPDLVPFQQAVAAVRRIAVDFQIESHDRIRTRLTEWQEEHLEPGIFKHPIYLTRTTLEQGVLVEFQIKSHASERGWYIVVNFGPPPLGRSD